MAERVRCREAAHAGGGEQRRGIVSNYQFYFSSQKFLSADPKIVDLVLAQLSEVDDWAKGDIKAVAEQLSPSVGLPVPVIELAL